MPHKSSQTLAVSTPSKLDLLVFDSSYFKPSHPLLALIQIGFTRDEGLDFELKGLRSLRQLQLYRSLVVVIKQVFFVQSAKHVQSLLWQTSRHNSLGVPKNASGYLQWEYAHSGALLRNIIMSITIHRGGKIQLESLCRLEKNQSD